jgi:CubicO group peptidase (beta-lactamase class C family)
MKLMLFRFAVLLFCAGTCLAQDAARMDQIVQSYVANKQFMGTVLVARGGQVLISKGYGSANLEWDIPNAPTTKFRLGSVSKQFTAAAILLLEERGRLQISDPVKKHVPDAPAAWDAITIFHVLTHTAGIPSFTSFPDYGKIKLSATTTAELVGLFRDKPLEFEPGEKFNYSNSGYVLLTHLIEKISGERYETFVRENLFAPLGMNDSGYDSNAAIIPRRAAGYSPGRNGPENTAFIHMSVPQGAGALYSTTEDLLKWNQGLFGGKVLQAASFEKMTQPFKNKYALGLTVDTPGTRKVIQHGGGIEGFNTLLGYYPDDQLTVVVLANLNGPAPQQIATQLAAVAFGEAIKLPSERKEIAVDPKILKRYVGAYGLGPGMLIALEGNQLTSKLGPQNAVPIFPESETLFFAKVVDAQIEFPATDADATASEMTLHQNGRSQKARRLDEAATQRMADAAAAVAQRIKDQKPAAGGEAALRKMIDDIRRGSPDYDMMSAGLADVTRRQLPQLQSMLTQLGAVQAITFKSVGPAGPDIYHVKLEKGSLEYRIWMTPEGKVESAAVRPTP